MPMGSPKHFTQSGDDNQGQYIDNWHWGAINWTTVSQYSDKFCIMANSIKTNSTKSFIWTICNHFGINTHGMSDTMGFVLHHVIYGWYGYYLQWVRVYMGTGAVWEILTHRLPILNPIYVKAQFFHMTRPSKKISDK